AKEVIDFFTPYKGMIISLAIVPMLSVIFCFGQLLYGSPLNLTSNLVFVLFLLVASLVLIYIYKNSFKLKNISNLRSESFELDGVKEKEFNSLNGSNSTILAFGGVLGLFVLLFATYILIGILQLVINTNSWADNSQFLNIIISTNTFIYFLFFLSVSICITSTVVMYKYLRDDSTSSNYNREYLEYVKRFSLRTGLIFAFVQPLLFVLSFLGSPMGVLSFSFFSTALFILLLMLVISVLFYLMYKDSNTKLSGHAIFTFLILFAVLIYKDQLAFDTASKKQMVNLENSYTIYEADLKEKLGIAEVIEISGKDIFDGKCVACHRFNTKLVGPAYNDVLPKYADNQEGLIEFILHPQKIDPDFVSMPSQGLKPNEAKAVAEYIVKIFNEEE
ncbi:MAG: c-type cytochrome, partial [Melioribacteraceae bacterium]